MMIVVEKVIEWVSCEAHPPCPGSGAEPDRTEVLAGSSGVP